MIEELCSPRASGRVNQCRAGRAREEMATLRYMFRLLIVEHVSSSLFRLLIVERASSLVSLVRRVQGPLCTAAAPVVVAAAAANADLRGRCQRC